MMMSKREFNLIHTPRNRDQVELFRVSASKNGEVVHEFYNVEGYKKANGFFYFFTNWVDESTFAIKISEVDRIMFGETPIYLSEANELSYLRSELELERKRTKSAQKLLEVEQSLNAALSLEIEALNSATKGSGYLSNHIKTPSGSAAEMRIQKLLRRQKRKWRKK